MTQICPRRYPQVKVGNAVKKGCVELRNREQEAAYNYAEGQPAYIYAGWQLFRHTSFWVLDMNEKVGI